MQALPSCASLKALRCGTGLPDPVSLTVCLLFAQIAGLDAKIDRLEKQANAEARQDEVARRFMTVLGTGPITAMSESRTVDDGPRVVQPNVPL